MGDTPIHHGMPPLASGNALCKALNNPEGSTTPGAMVVLCDQPVSGRYVSVQKVQRKWSAQAVTTILSMCEVQVYAQKV